MTSLKTSIKTITYLSDIGCLEIQGASLVNLAHGSTSFAIVDILYATGDITLCLSGHGEVQQQASCYYPFHWHSPVAVS